MSLDRSRVPYRRRWSISSVKMSQPVGRARRPAPILSTSVGGTEHESDDSYSRSLNSAATFNPEWVAGTDGIRKDDSEALPVRRGSPHNSR